MVLLVVTQSQNAIITVGIIHLKSANVIKVLMHALQMIIATIMVQMQKKLLVNAITQMQLIVMVNAIPITVNAITENGVQI